MYVGWAKGLYPVPIAISELLPLRSVISAHLKQFPHVSHD